MKSLTKPYWDSNLPIYKVSQAKLENEGIKGLILDVDGTLLSRNSTIIPLNVKEWIFESKKIFRIFLISNNPSKKRIEKIGNELGIDYKFKALKPSKKKVIEVLKIFKEDNKNVAIIGDRIFTDILVGNRCNIKSILVQRLNKKGLPIFFNITLLIEKFLSNFIL